MAEANTLGLALSGGGSRAVAFHCGTLSALDELNLLEKVNVISSVSGGSVFGAAWMAARLGRKTTTTFIASMQKELRSGFVLRSLLSWKLLLLLVPGFRRSDLIADTFDRFLCDARTLEELPEAPLLCLNTSVLNHGQVGKFSRFGFSTHDLGNPRPGGGNTPVPMSKFKLARAAAASAAFPIGLPPLLLSAADLGDARRNGLLEGNDPLALSDGGVLENLGVQTLLKGRRFGTWNIVVSDAGQRDVAWSPRSPWHWLTAFGIAVLSASSLRRVLELMNDKENRSMRSAIVLEAERSWILERISGATAETLAPIVRDLQGAEPDRPRRRLLFVRLNQDWNSLLANIPAWRLRELSPLLLLDLGYTVTAAAEALGTYRRETARIGKRYLAGGLEHALGDNPRPKPLPLLDSTQEAAIVAMVCGPPPEGRARWTVRFVATETVRRGMTPTLGRETARVALADHGLKPWREKNVVRAGNHQRVRRPHGGRAPAVRT